MEPRISLITLGVRDLKRSVAFYRDGLGWPLSESTSGDSVAFFRTGGTILALFGWNDLAADATVPADGSGFRGVTFAYNAPSREAVDAALAKAEAAGAKIVKPAQEVFWGGYNGYFADPDGHLWEVAWNPGFPLGPDGTVLLPE